MPQVTLENVPIEICLNPHTKTGGSIGCGHRPDYTPNKEYYSHRISLGTWGHPDSLVGEIFEIIEPLSGKQIGILEVIDTAYYKQGRIWSPGFNKYISYNDRCSMPSYEFRLTLNDGTTHSCTFITQFVTDLTVTDYEFVTVGGETSFMGIKTSNVYSWTTGFETPWPTYCDYDRLYFNNGEYILGLNITMEELGICTPGIETGQWTKIGVDGCYDVYQRTIVSTKEDCLVESIIEEDRRYSAILCPPATTGIVTLETDPPGATIIIGDQELISPVTIDLEPGIYEVIIDLGGYETVRETIVVGVGKTTPLAVSMEEAPSIVPKVIVGTVLSIGLYGLIRKLRS